MKSCSLLAGLCALSASFAAAAADGPFDSMPAIWTAGVTLTISPEYEGSDEYQVIPIPYVFPRFGDANLVEVRGADDVRFKLLKTNNFEVGPLAGYRFDREEEDGDKLVGLGDVDGGLVVGGFARVALGQSGFFAGLSYHRTVTGDVDGGQLKFGLEYEAKPSQNISFFARAGATYADDDYMSEYFGVNATQAANSAVGLQEFDAEAGIKDVYAVLGTSVMLSERWTLNLSGRYARLVGDAADSPVIETEDQLSGAAGLNYRFDFK